MDEVLQRYKQGKFQKCLELLKLLPESDDLIDNFVMENSKLVCESLITISGNDPDKIYETQEQLYLFFDRVTSTGLITTIPIQLRLTVTFNFIFWLLFYNDTEVDEFEIEEYFELVNVGLLRVLGKQVSSVASSSNSEKILESLHSLGTLINKEEHNTVILVIELVIVVVLYVIKLKRNLLEECAKVVDVFINECKGIGGQVSVNDFLKVKSLSLCLFKFGVMRTSSVLSELDSNVVNYLSILQSVIFFLLGNSKESLKTLQKNINSCDKSLWIYLVVLNAFELKKWDLCLGFLNKSSEVVMQKNLKARFHVIRGKLHCVERNHKEALKEFENALSLSSKCPVIYYYIGQEYGRMGIHDLMAENFEKLLEAVKNEDLEEDFRPNFETILLDWIHPFDEITEMEAYYSLAVAYGLNEDLKKAAEAFEKTLGSSTIPEKKSIVQLPNSLTLFHDAAIMNLQVGNLARAEQIIWDAIDRYLPQVPVKKEEHQNSLLHKDVEWLQKVIHQELLESDLEPKELAENVFYSEDLTFCFSQNVIALLILSEIQKIQGVEDYKSTLSNVFSLFSKYLATMHKKEVEEEDEVHMLTLIKALAGKTCLRIAAEQMKEKNDSGVEKMFKRALSCNKGDKDALSSYYAFLSRVGKKKEALKLWRTFFGNKDTVCVDSLQSFSLRYFLKNKVTKREIEKIQKEIELTDVRLY